MIGLGYALGTIIVNLFKLYFTLVCTLNVLVKTELKYLS